MAKSKFDLVVEAVHYDLEGKVSWVRGYERRGPTFSDRVLIDRSALIQRMQRGDKVVIGQRIPLKASTFEISGSIHLIQKDGADLLTSGFDSSEHEHLSGIPSL